MIRGAAGILLVAFAAAAEEPGSGAASWEFRGSVAYGAGLSYGLTGLRLELGAGPITVFAATGGQLFAVRDWDFLGTAGVRWSLLRPDDGPAVSLHLTYATQQFIDVGRYSIATLGATLSYRVFLVGPLYFELGGGPAFRWNSVHYPPDYTFAGQTIVTTGWGIQWTPTPQSFPFNVEGGIGASF